MKRQIADCRLELADQRAAQLVEVFNGEFRPQIREYLAGFQVPFIEGGTNERSAQQFSIFLTNND
jgi:hypothetical protein